MLNETTQKRIIVTRYQTTGQYFTEDLGNGVDLDMVYIPGGTFLMGAPEDELESRDNERPQHEVTLQFFFMGRYAVTQAQWGVVANYPQIERKLDPNPSRFTGDNRPVENVSWENAVEFCKRLSKKTEREYKLPSEAQWEYACRAGTKTPFHFGETITTDLANYNGTDDQWGSYGRGTKGEYREQTTEVGSFLANRFGLYDMHGNVGEWCEDDYHESYEGAPTDRQNLKLEAVSPLFSSEHLKS
jgi:formylglycine-generating enzyme required for sulfatase activity